MTHVTAYQLTKTSSPACSPQYQMIVPKGTRVDYVDGKPVVGDVTRVLHGNAHDLAHYYIWLEPQEIVCDILQGHTSPDTAYVVDDYPYGFRLRCKVRYWLEYDARRGFRLVSQTTNPKRGNVWNKPKASTYAKFGGAMYLDGNRHVQWSGLSEYSSGKEAAEWRDTFGAGVPEAGRKVTDAWVNAKLAYDGNRKDGDALSVGFVEARKAFVESFR